MAFERKKRTGPPRRRFGRRKVCRFCADKKLRIDLYIVTSSLSIISILFNSKICKLTPLGDP